MRRLVGAALAMAGMVAAGIVLAEDFTPAIVLDMGGKFDESFNAAAYDGAERYKVETGVQYLEFEVADPATREQTIRKAARRRRAYRHRDGLFPGRRRPDRRPGIP